MLETLDKRALLAVDVLQLGPTESLEGTAIESGSLEEPKATLLGVKQALIGGNTAKFPSPSGFSSLIDGVKGGEIVSNAQAVDVAWDDFEQRLGNMRESSKAAFDTVRAVASDPSKLQSKLLNKELGVRSIDDPNLGAGEALGPAIPGANVTQFAIQGLNSPIAGASVASSRQPSAFDFSILPSQSIGWFCTIDGEFLSNEGEVVSPMLAEGEDDDVPNVSLPVL